MSKISVNRSGFHSIRPDYDCCTYRFSAKTKERILVMLKELYGERKAKRTFTEMERVAKVYYAHKTEKMLEWEKEFAAEERFSEEDVILITYGDLIRDKESSPLKTLSQISKTYFKGVFNTLHLLPFFPYSSDRGFAVIDFKQVDPNLGTWNDILDLKSDFKLMYDAVFNHISSKSFWFQEFLNQNPFFEDFFIDYSEKRKMSKKDMQKVFRPRTSDLLTPFQTLNGKRYVWTTFGADQIDLKFQNPDVLLKIMEVLFYYVRRGADIIRLDAVTYLWYEKGSTGVHLPQTHLIIKLFRLVLDAVAPHVALITETNVPHQDNISYFGNGADEAQLVYNFALPPLVLHTFLTKNCNALSAWAKTLHPISKTANFFNFLDSHDGIGVMGAKGILSEDEIAAMGDHVKKHGGELSNKRNSDGSESVYELNITFFSALNDAESHESIDLQVDRYIAARSIPLCFKGIPGIYLHGFLGSPNDREAILQGEEKRSINRKNLQKAELIEALEDQTSTTFKITRRLISMIQKRVREKAFHPNARQQLVESNDSVFSLIRESQDREDLILCVVNVSTEKQVVCLKIGNTVASKMTLFKDLLSAKKVHSDGETLSFSLSPYQVMWLKATL